MNITTIKQLAVEHRYYCNDANYYSNECLFKFDTFDQLLAEMGEADLDYNLLFRWDVKEIPHYETGEPTGGYYMSLYWMHQRKGIFVINEVAEVTDEDVPNILAFLKPRHTYLKNLWKPLK